MEFGSHTVDKMAIISVIKRGVGNVVGDRRINEGTFQAGGGEINTGMEVCDFLSLQGTATAPGSVPVINEPEFPRGGTAITIISNSPGIWFAYGR